MGDPAIDATRVLDRYFVERRAIPEHDLEARPVFGDARCEDQKRTLAAQAENRFDSGLIHPPGRACIPCPSAASGMRRIRIDIGGGDVWLDLLAMHGCPRGRAVDGIDQREQTGGLVALAQS